MRRNRKRGKGGLGDVTTLAGSPDGGATLAPTIVLADAPPAEVAPIGFDAVAVAESLATPVADDPISLETLSEVPVLTDVVVQAPIAVAETPFPWVVVEEAIAHAGRAGAPELGDAFPASAGQAAVAAAALPSPVVLEQEPSAAAPAQAPAEPRESPPAALEDDFILEIPPAAEAPRPPGEESPIPAVAGPSLLPPAGPEWDSLAEEIRMQVLQRLDLFTDTGLREQLGARLQPIVDRASAELIETINHELGELVRGYVAEAIEREIESWRKRES
ncbi:MAG TPA: hypothetical protein VF059_13755 [Casimicrobiaceae bacterium]